METVLPDVFAAVCRASAERLERHYRDMQDVEFTVERGKLWMLQTRAASAPPERRCAPPSRWREEGLISEAEAVLRIDPGSLDQLLHPTIDPKAERNVIATGLPASPGAATGEIVFNADEAEQLRSAGRKVILVRVETSPEDIHGMHAAEGILTTRGGMTSHAAVVARGMGKPCVTGAGAMRIEYPSAAFCRRAAHAAARRHHDDRRHERQGDRGAIEMRQPEFSGEFGIIMQWADKLRRMSVRANAETAADAEAARASARKASAFAAPSICFSRRAASAPMREMILAEDERGPPRRARQTAADQRSDFAELFEIMSGLPVTIRLLDPPLHEFLPHTAEEIAEVACRDGCDARNICSIAPRNCTNLIRCSAFAAAGCRCLPRNCGNAGARDLRRRGRCQAQTGVAPEPEIMVPLVVIKAELDTVKASIERCAEAVSAETGETISYHRRHDDRIAARGASRRARSPKARNSSRSAPTI